ncbi:MAG: putative drug exporter of the superfamily, partial [Pseudonocardiales bacterium]|nr:putative drug exporter of the superfamily [Pseudonocardiales bacterium]
MNALTRLSLKRPRLVIGFWLIVLASSGALALHLPDAMKAGGFNNPRGSAVAGQSTLEKAFGDAPTSLQVVLYDADQPVAPIAAAAAAKLRGFEHVVSVQDARTHPNWVSKDGHTTFLQIGFGSDNNTTQNLVPELHTATVSAVADPSVEVAVTGAPALDYALNLQSAEDAKHAELIAFPLLFLVLFLVFRSVAATLIPVSMAGLSIVVSHGIGYLLSRVTEIEILYTNVVSLIGLAVAVDYCLFIVKRYRDELAAGADTRPALLRAMGTAGHSVMFSGLVVVVALLTLLIPRMMVFSSVALAGAVVTLVALGLTLTLLPAVLLLLGPRISWGRLRTRRQPRTARAARFDLSRLRRRPKLLLLLLVPAFLILAAPMSGIRLQVPVASASILPAGTEARTGIERIDQNLALRDLFPIEVVLSAPASGGAPRLLDAARAVTGLAGKQGQTLQTRAVTELAADPASVATAAGGDLTALPAANRAAFQQLWTRSGEDYVTRVQILSKAGPDAVGTHELVASLRNGLPAAVGDGVRSQVTGATAQGADFDNVVRGSLPLIVLAAAFATLLLLRRAFSSWLAPLLALAFNALVVTASLGLLSLIYQKGLDQPINSVTPLLLFAIMFGLSMDYMVIMMSRMREFYREGYCHHDASETGLRRSAGM